MNIFFHLHTENSCISVSNPDSSKTLFMDWDEATTQQITKQPDAITFTNLTNRDECLVHIRTAPEAESIPSHAKKIAYVSFSIGQLGISISGSGEPIHVDIPAGDYRLIFHAIPGLLAEDLDTYEFVFVKS